MRNQFVRDCKYYENVFNELNSFELVSLWFSNTDDMKIGTPQYAAYLNRSMKLFAPYIVAVVVANVVEDIIKAFKQV